MFAPHASQGVIVALLSMSCAYAQAVVHVTVDLSDVKTEVPRTLYGSGMEDVNHEIYGGLDAQRLYDESFEETLPPQVIPHSKRGSGRKFCGRQWDDVIANGGEVRQDKEIFHLGACSQSLMPNGGSAGVANRGLNGWGIPCREGKRMVGRLFVRGCVDRLEVALQRCDGRITYATNSIALVACEGWKQIDFDLIPDTTDPQGRFLVCASGNGKVWIDDVFLMDEPTNEFGRIGCREDIVEGFRKEGLTFLRWGGTMVNTPEYSLKYAKDDRRPYRGYWFRISSTGFHIREFVRMSAKLNLPCAFSIYAYEDDTEAVALAEWLRQFDIDIYVEIGNEELTSYGDDQASKCDMQTCLRYCESVKRLVSLMRAANPKLKFVSAVMFRPNHIDIMETAFKLTDGLVEYWDVHVSADNAMAGDKARKFLQTFRGMMNRINPKSAMKLAIFEENSYIHDMGRALAHATILEAVRELGPFVLTSCPANALQAYAQNDNGWDQGQIFFTTDKVWLQPCGWAQQMASSNHRDLLVAGNTDAMDVSVSATRDRAGKSIVLHLVNRSSESRPIFCDFKDAKVKLVRAIALSSPNLDDHNPPDDPDRISPKDVTPLFADKQLLFPYSYTVVEFAKLD